MWQQPFGLSLRDLLFYSVGYLVASAYPFLPGSVVARHLSKLNPGRAFQNAVPLLYCGVGGCLRFELDST